MRSYYQNIFFFLFFLQLSSSTSEGVDNLSYSSPLPENPDVEPVSSEVQQRTAVCIRNLEKTFNPRGKQPVKAVDGRLHLCYVYFGLLGKKKIIMIK